MAFAGINGQQIFFQDSGGDGAPVANLTHPEPVDAAIVQSLAALPA
jgi:hypothetical protein